MHQHLYEQWTLFSLCWSTACDWTANELAQIHTLFVTNITSMGSAVITFLQKTFFIYFFRKLCKHDSCYMKSWMAYLTHVCLQFKLYVYNYLYSDNPFCSCRIKKTILPIKIKHLHLFRSHFVACVIYLCIIFIFKKTTIWL